MRETQILRGLHKARANMGHNYADGYAPGAMDLRRGVAKLKGPGTTTSDSIPANLSRGEAVLPAKTVQKVGAGNIARLIEQTNGKPPARGLRAGGKHARGAIPGMEVTESFDELKVPTRDEGIAKMKARQAPPMGNTTTAGTAPVQEPAGPQTFKQRAASTFASGKATVSGAASSAAAPLKTAAAGAKGLGAGALGGYVGNSAAEAARTVGKPAGDAGAYVDDPRTAAIPTEGYSPAPQKQQYNYFTDNETGRNVGNTLNAAAMIPGVGPVARSALGMGTGVISRTARAAGNPLVAGALQGASANVRDGRDQTEQPAASTQTAQTTQTAATAATAPPTAGNPYADANAAKLAAPSIHVERQPNGVMSFSNTADTGQNNYTGPGAAGLRRGNMNVMPAFKADGPATSDADLAVMRANLRDGVALSRGTPQGAQDNSPQSLIMQRIQSGLGAGQSLTAAGVAALQGLNTTDKNYKASMYGHEVSRDNSLRGNQVTREGNELQYQGGLNRLNFDMQQKAIERGVEGEKASTEDLKNDPSSYVTNEKKEQVFSSEKAARLSKYISETQPMVDIGDGRRMTLAQAREHYPEAAKAVQQQLSNDFALRELAHEYSREAVAGKGTQTGPLKLGAVRKIQPTSDIVGNDTHALGGLKTLAMSPFTGGNVVEVQGVGGRTIALPMDVISAHPQGRAMLDAINRQRAAQKQSPIDAYGNAVK